MIIGYKFNDIHTFCAHMAQETAVFQYTALITIIILNVALASAMCSKSYILFLNDLCLCLKLSPEK